MDREQDRPRDAGAGHGRLDVPGQLARTESAVGFSDPAPQARTVRPDFDVTLIRNSFAHLIAKPDEAMEYLYARLFVTSPQLRALFPLAMTTMREAVFRALARLVWGLHDQAATEQALGQLARDHRKFGVTKNQYPPFFDALLVVAEHSAGPAWTAQTSAAWRSALDYFAAVMAAAADEDAQARPAWWTGEVVQHDRRAETVAVLTIRPDRPLSYQPGQYLWVQAPRWPRVWRRYSIANAPRENGLLDIHVRAVPGGMVSTALVSHCAAGDSVTLGAAGGELRVLPDGGRDMVGVAGGTGLAPVKAITEAIIGAAGHGRRRSVTLYVGAQRSRDLYDMRDLEALSRAYPSLTLIPVVERELDFAGRVGRLPEVVATHPSFRDCDVYVAGPAGMVSATARALSGRVPSGRLHHDPIEALRLASSPLNVDYLSR